MNERKSRNWVDEAVFASWWLTWEDMSWPDPKLTEKWKRRAAHFQSRGINAVVMFGLHFRFDYVGYLDRVFGLLREIAEICHAHGLRVVEHHSAVLVHRARDEFDRHEIRRRNFHHVPFYPDDWSQARYGDQPMQAWRQVSAVDGEPIFFERYTSACFCPNNPEYQKSYLDYTRRHLEAVPVDGYMSDDVHFFPDFYTCGCEHCRRRFREEAGIELPPVDDHTFWENYENPHFLKWIELRYKWNAEHYQRLRKLLPDDVLLWGCAANLIHPRLAAMGTSPVHFAEHWDAVFHEIFHEHQPGQHDTRIASELAAFAGLARHHDKPLIALFYAKGAEDLPKWRDTLAFHGARPWLSTQPRDPDAPSEETLLQVPFDYPSAALSRDNLTGVVFSHETRDRLGPRAESTYVEPFRTTCYELCKAGKEVDVMFDGQWEDAAHPHWRQIYVPGAALLSSARRQTLEQLQAKGVSVEFA